MFCGCALWSLALQLSRMTVEPPALEKEDGFHGLAADRREAVYAALAAAFGRSSVDSAADSAAVLAGGATDASVFRMVIRGRPYLLRAEGPAGPLRNPHQYVSMAIAAEAGIAPKLHYVDDVRGIAIMDYIEQRPLSAFPGGPPALMQALGALLTRLQDTPSFPFFVEYPDIVARLFAHVRRTGLFVDGLLDRHVDRFAELHEAYAAGKARLVSSHNDSNPRNILFDGERLWLIDWESAYRNDPLVDVAIVADSLASSEELEEILLRAWLGNVPDEGIRARLAIVRALTRLYFAGVFLSASAAAAWREPDRDLSAPTFQQYRQAVADGLLRPGAPETKHILGKMFLASFYANARPPGFDTAV